MKRAITDYSATNKKIKTIEYLKRVFSEHCSSMHTNKKIRVSRYCKCGQLLGNNNGCPNEGYS